MRRRVDVRKKLSGRVVWKVMKWSGHVKCMSGERLSKRVSRAEVDGKLDRDRLRTR